MSGYTENELKEREERARRILDKLEAKGVVTPVEFSAASMNQAGGNWTWSNPKQEARLAPEPPAAPKEGGES